MPDEPKGVYALGREERLELALALMRRQRLGADGRSAFRAAYPEAADEMVNTAAFHVYVDGPDAVITFLADAELFLRDRSHRMSLGVTWEVLYHLYNWLQFRELLPDGRQNVLELLKELKQFVAEDDRDAIVKTAEELENALDGSRDHPQFE
jgi:hypothetical protein